jgi:hypothetical protein
LPKITTEQRKFEIALGSPGSPTLEHLFGLDPLRKDSAMPVMPMRRKKKVQEI